MDLKFVSFLIIVFIMIGSNCSTNTQEEPQVFSTSVAGMKPLLKVEHELIELLDNYAEELQNKLDTLDSAVTAMRDENDKALQNPEKFLSNPINTFVLIRTLHADWPALLSHMSKPVGLAQIRKLRRYRAGMPKSKDLKDAVIGILRLQTTYKLKAMDMAKGLLHGKQYKAKLSSSDCFSIGVKLLIEKKPNFAGLWLHTALYIHESDELEYISGFSKLNIWNLYAKALSEQNKLKEALKIAELGLKKFPKSEVLLHRIADIKHLVKNGVPPEKLTETIASDSYDSGCRGEYQQISRLHCRYNSTTTAFAKLAPFKMEEVNLQPYMVLFHDVISDKEITELKKTSEPQLKPTGVYGGWKFVDGRTAHGVWLPDNTNNLTMRVNRRIADMTGLNLEGADHLQIINYGLGGHYTLHFDCTVNTKEATLDNTNDRVATVLLYLSDVEKGGATVFPRLKKAIHPRKGSAIHWYNLNNRGGGEPLALHGGCPVIVGSKWIASKWIRMGNQTFTKPCYPEA